MLLRGFLAGFVVAGASCVLSAQIPATPRPKLIVLLMVDQMRRDYIDEYGAQWSGGLRRLVDQGAWFRNAAYPYMNTVTCAGHATVSTGTFPASHGMIANEWWDRASSRTVGCTDDDKATAVSYGSPTQGGNGPWRLKRPTLADELRGQAPVAPRIATFSLKERTAITLAGQQADAVLWLDDDTNAWVTSSVYATKPVDFIARLVHTHPIAAEFGQVWNLLLPASAYQHHDAAAGELPPRPWTNQFPHRIEGLRSTPDDAFYEVWKTSPLADRYLERLAEAAIFNLEMGRGDRIDLLGIGFSALDYVGHSFGPRSHEVQDLLLRLDQTIGALFQRLDAIVGAGRYIVALSADHGAAPIPEQMRAEGADAGRIEVTPLGQRLEHALKRLGPDRHIAKIDGSDVYFVPGVAERLASDPPLLNSVLETIRSMPGVSNAFTAIDLTATTPTSDSTLQMARLSFERERSGDLVIAAKPGWVFSDEDSNGVPDSATTHGTSNVYDTRVPVILMGPGITPGRYAQPATPADIAPTLAVLGGFRMERADGRVLREALTEETR